MDRAVNECRFLAFFFPSPRLWHPLFPLDGEGPGEGPGEQGPSGAGAGAGAGEGAELGPGTGATTDLSISISCLAVSFSWKRVERERDGDVRGREDVGEPWRYSRHLEPEADTIDIWTIRLIPTRTFSVPGFFFLATPTH